MTPPFAFFQRWFPHEINHWDGFLRFIDAKAPKIGRLLDLGCGDNSLLARFRTPEREAWGTDFVPHPHLCHPQWFRALDADGTLPFDDGTFDLVCSHMVMEHVASPRQFLREIARVLKPGGWYIGESIHARHYVTWIRRLFDLVPHAWVQTLVRQLYGRAEHDTFPTCYRMNSRCAIARFAVDAQLDLADWRGYVSPGYFAFSPMLYRGAVVFDWCVERVLPGFGQLYFTVLLRKPDNTAILRRAA
jgi:SAM-dependent methyltransferase